MKEIVAARIGTVVTNNPRLIRAALELGRKDIEFLDRQRMQFMAAMDLGPRWERLAESPTLFLMDENGEPFPVRQDNDERRNDA